MMAAIPGVSRAVVNRTVSDRVSATHTFPLMSRLALGVEDAVWLNLSDSTGNGMSRWCYLVAQSLAEMFPTHTVIFRAWNFTNGSYDAAVTIQVGTGPRKLTIYNGAASGQTPDYSQAQIASATTPVIAPEIPHLVSINHGHNADRFVTNGAAGPAGSTQGPTGFRYPLYKLCRTVRSKWPNAGLILTAQNPQAPGAAADPAGQYIRARVTAELAAAEGYGLINVMQAYLDTPNWATELLVPDGVHPDDVKGSPLWKREALKQFQLPKSGLLPRASKPGTNRVIIPAPAFVAESGSTLTAVAGSGNGAYAGLSFPQGVDSFAVAMSDVPDHWTAFNAHIYWLLPATTVGNTYWRYFTGYASNAYGTGGGRALLTNAAQGAFLSGALAGGTNQVVQVMSTYDLAARPLMHRVGRLGATTSQDTLAAGAVFHGLVLERAA